VRTKRAGTPGNYQVGAINANAIEQKFEVSPAVLGLTLVTADYRLLGLGTIATLANR